MNKNVIKFAVLITWTVVGNSCMNVLVYADGKRWLNAVSYFIQTHPLGTDAEPL